MLRYAVLLLIGLLIIDCKKEDQTIPTNLQGYLDGNSIKTSNVIACAASDIDSPVDNLSKILVFYYPRADVSNVQLFETASLDEDSSLFEHYTLVNAQAIDVFGGELQRFEIEREIENWLIVTFEENDTIHISNPIRTKIITAPTDWSTAINIDQSTSQMPVFEWTAVPESTIYFQIVNELDETFISGTYTFETHFQYYNTENVVLNITPNNPPSLVIGRNYNFTLMGVSEDNWVHGVGMREFEVE